MDTIKYYLVSGWIWMVFAWGKVRSWAPWKAIFIIYVLMVLAMFVFDRIVYAITGWMPYEIVDFILSMVVFYCIYSRVLRRVYPNGWYNHE